MDILKATVAFAAISQETRLRLFKLLVEYGPGGAPAGTLSEQLGVPHNTLSFHLSTLSQAGLVSSVKNGRSVIYSANTTLIESLIDYLQENCCIRQAGDKSCAPPKARKTRAGRAVCA